VDTSENEFEAAETEELPPVAKVFATVTFTFKFVTGENVVLADSVPVAPTVVSVGQVSELELSEKIRESLPVTPQVTDPPRSAIAKPLRAVKEIVSPCVLLKPEHGVGMPVSPKPGVIGSALYVAVPPTHGPVPVVKGPVMLLISRLGPRRHGGPLVELHGSRGAA